MKKMILFLLALTVLNAAASTFLENFEAPVVTNGALNGQNGWVLDSGANAIVQSGTVATNSSQALEIQSSQISHALSISSNSVWVSFQARITAAPETNPAVTNPNTSIAFFVNTNRNLVVYNGTNRVELTTVKMPTNQWVRFDIFCDYSNLKWTLGIDGTNVASNLQLYSDNSQIGSVLIANESTSSVYFDELAVQDTEPTNNVIDTNANSIPDWWEQKYTGGITNAIADNISSNGGLTYLQAYIAGVSPNLLDPFVALKASHGRGLRWTAKPGRIYDVEWAPDLMTSFSNIATVSWRDAPEFIDNTSNTNAPSGFYRLKARLE